MIEIVNRFDRTKVIYRSESAVTVEEAVIELLKSEPHQKWMRGEEGGTRADLAHANLAGANLAHADLAHADLAHANLAGAYLAHANLAHANLAGAYLAGAYLARAYLAHANLAGANLAGAYLARAYLASANLAGAYLADAYLADAYLADAYLADAYIADARNVPGGTAKVDPPEPYTRNPAAEAVKSHMMRFREHNPDVPVVENLDAKILAAIEGEAAIGKLDMSTWHADGVCGTTHCRAGWAIVLAGEAGKAMERRFDSQRAGSLIYRASTGRVPHFFASNDRALEDIRRCAAEQTNQTTEAG